MNWKIIFVLISMTLSSQCIVVPPVVNDRLFFPRDRSNPHNSKKIRDHHEKENKKN